MLIIKLGIDTVKYKSKIQKKGYSQFNNIIRIIM